MTRSRTSLLAKALLIVMTAAPATAAVLALAQEPPVFPILYGGTVFVDGQPAPEGASLIAQVGDRQYRAVVEQRGFYHGLLVAPPTKEYYDRPITFHLEEMVAQEQDLFLPAGGPIFKDSGYDLHFSRAAQPTETPASSATPLPATPTVQAYATLVPATPTLPQETPGAPAGSGVSGLALAMAGGVVLAAAGVGWYVWIRTRRR